MLTDNEIKQQALAVISQYFGQNTAKLYEDYYQGKDANFIKNSINELLSEVVGASMASKIIQDIKI